MNSVDEILDHFARYDNAHFDKKDITQLGHGPISRRQHRQ